MISNYYVLKRLAAEWNTKLVGAQIADAYSQSADELSLIFEAARSPEKKLFTMRMSTAAPLRYLLLGAGSGRAKRNTADVLESIVGAVITGVNVVSGDRILDVQLEDNRRIQMVLFGSNANAFVVGRQPTNLSTEDYVVPASDSGADDEGAGVGDADDQFVIVDAFQSARRFVGKTVPARKVTMLKTVSEFADRWRTEAKGNATCGQVIGRIEPLYNRFMADEVVLRSGIAVKKRASEVDDDTIANLFEGIQQLTSNIEASVSAWVYWADEKPERLTLFPSDQMADFKAEQFDSVSDAVGVFIRSSLSKRSLSDEHSPVLKKIGSAKKRAQRRFEEITREVGESSRAERYEKYGHVLMAQPSATTDSRSELVDPHVAQDIFAGGEISIPIDATLSLIENANRYYEKAKSARLARESAEARLSGAKIDADKLTKLYDAVSAIQTLDEWRQFSKANEESLRPFAPPSAQAAPTVPFRQFELANGYVVWVGRNAKQNELLSSKAARKFDLWFHARGVPGSHVVLRLPQRNTEPDGHIVEQAAQIAAYYSKARGGSMVPVIVTEAKYVRKPRGAAPGSVIVERERVLLVEPGLPA